MKILMMVGVAAMRELKIGLVVMEIIINGPMTLVSGIKLKQLLKHSRRKTTKTRIGRNASSSLKNLKWMLS